MKAIVWRDCRQFFTGKIFWLVAGCFLFVFSERQTTNYSYEQFVLHMLSEHYYLTYFVIPAFLLFTYKSLEEEMDYVLIRSRYYWKCFWAKALALFLNMIGFVSVQVVVMLLVAIRLPSNNSFVIPADDSLGGMSEVFLIYAKYLSSPISAVIAAGMYMIIGLTVVSILFLMLHHFLEKKTVSVVMISLYVLMTFGLKIPGLNEIPFLFINNYIILFYNFSTISTFIISIVTMLMILTVTMILIKYYWQKRPTWQFEFSGKGITFYYARYLFTKRTVLIIFAVLFFISIWKFVNITSLQNPTAEEFFLSLFYGHGVNKFYVLGFLEMLIINGIPLYLFAIFIEQIHNEQSVGLLIRLKRKQNWTTSILRIAMAFIAMYIGIFAGIGLILVMMKGLSIAGMTQLILEMSILKFLDIYVQFLVFLLLYIWKRNVTIAFLIVLGTNILSILPMKAVIFFPTGISSMARSNYMLGEDGMSFMMAALILGILSCSGWLYIKYKGYQKVLGG